MSINIKVTQERLEADIISIGEINKMQKGNLDAIVSVLAKFLIDPETEEYYPVTAYNVVVNRNEAGEKVKVKVPVSLEDADDESVIVAHPDALERVSNIRPGRLKELNKEFQYKLRDGAVPPTNGSA